MKIIHVETELPAAADKVWAAMLHPASFTYVARGVIGFPVLAGRTEPYREGESGRGWLMLFHVIPLGRHTIELAEIDEATRTLRTREHSLLLRVWNHTLHVEPQGERSRYSDTVEIDAGPLTGIVAWVGVQLYRYRQRRWRRLARRHLMAGGPRYALEPRS